MRDQIGVAVLGCGYWGMNYVRIFQELADTRIVAVCDRDANRLQEVGRRFPGVILTTEIKNTLSISGVDAVVICTPATSHYKVAMQSLRAGKHALVEKPIATAVSHADEMRKTADEFGLTLMVGHTFLFNSGIRYMKQYIDESQIGRVYYLYSSRTNLGPIRRDVNALWDLAAHDIAIFSYLLGKAPEWVSAVGVSALKSRREDVGFISLGYPSGIVGNIHVSWADPNKVREVVVVGSEKRIAFNDLNSLEQVRVFEKSVAQDHDEPSNYGEYRLLMRDGNIISPLIDASEPLKNQCRHFLECITTSNRPLTGGWEGREVVRVMESVDRSLRRGGAPVKLTARATKSVVEFRSIPLAPPDQPNSRLAGVSNGQLATESHV